MPHAYTGLPGRFTIVRTPFSTLTNDVGLMTVSIVAACVASDVIVRTIVARSLFMVRLHHDVLRHLNQELLAGWHRDRRGNILVPVQHRLCGSRGNLAGCT